MYIYIYSDCGNPEKCPVTQFKAKRTLQFQVKLDSKYLRQYDRFRVQEVRVMLPGITAHAKVTLQLNNMGIIKDRYQDKEYKFSSIGRQLFYVFSYSARKSSKHFLSKRFVSRGFIWG